VPKLSQFNSWLLPKLASFCKQNVPFSIQINDLFFKKEIQCSKLGFRGKEGFNQIVLECLNLGKEKPLNASSRSWLHQSTKSKVHTAQQQRRLSNQIASILTCGFAVTSPPFCLHRASSSSNTPCQNLEDFVSNQEFLNQRKFLMLI